jgi:hypothetical protein
MVSAFLKVISRKKIQINVENKSEEIVAKLPGQFQRPTSNLVLVRNQ